MEQAKKSLGQHFLIDKNIRNKIINIDNLYNEKVLEIGPGKGFLTDYIIEKKIKKLVLIEKDRNLYELLKKKYQNIKNIELKNEDCLKIDFDEYRNFIIISNLPYNITSKFIMKLLFTKVKIKKAILMIQKEVADKINPKNISMNKYKFLINYTSIFRIHFEISKNVFFPKPKINSSIITIKQKKIIENEKKLKNFINQFFNNKRKIISNLLPSYKLNKNIKNEILNKRVENLNYNEILLLLKFF